MKYEICCTLYNCGVWLLRNGNFNFNYGNLLKTNPKYKKVKYKAPDYFKAAQDQFRRAMWYFSESHKQLKIVSRKEVTKLRPANIVFLGELAKASASLAEAFLVAGKDYEHQAKDLESMKVDADKGKEEIGRAHV